MSFTDFEQQLLVYLDQQYNLTGAILTTEAAEKEGIPPVKYKAALANPLFKAALVERGVTFRSADVKDWSNKSLTPTQLIVANSMLDLTDTRSAKKKLQDLQVTTLRFNTWLKDPAFKEYMHRRADNMLIDNQHEASLALLDRVKLGDVKAIEYYFMLTGKYTPPSNKTGGGGQFDAQALLNRILEIIDTHVKDPEILQAIATDFKRMVASRSLAQSIVDTEPIEMPQIAPIRVVSEQAVKDEIEVQ